MELAETPVLHLIPGVSASGKTSMARYMSRQFGSLAQVVVPHTTRPPRIYEEHGMDYFFHSTQDYEDRFSRVVNRPDSEWVSSKIGNYYYFNSHTATRPDREKCIKILPVAFSVFNEVVEEHADQGYGVSVLPIIIGEEIQEEWLLFASQQRPTRDLSAELEEQTTFTDQYSGTLFYPTWNQKADALRYFQAANTAIHIARLAIRTM